MMPESDMAYPSCPKCGHAPLPEDQSLPAACPACGLVLAKFAAAPAWRARAVEDTPRSEAEHTFLTGWLFRMPERVARVNWIARIVTLAAISLWTIWIWSGTDVAAGEIGSRFLHSVLIPFHEAGHYAIFRWFGEFIMILGGTLGQHLMPVVLGLALLIKRRDAFGAALFFWLLGFSVIDMAVYMYDAHDPKLMLLTGRTGAESDSHDWINIFADLNLLNQARGIGVFFGWAGKAMMVAGLAWAAWVLRLQRGKLSDALLAEVE
jgi:hypothetical protein